MSIANLIRLRDEGLLLLALCKRPKWTVLLHSVCPWGPWGDCKTRGDIFYDSLSDAPAGAAALYAVYQRNIKVSLVFRLMTVSGSKA